MHAWVNFCREHEDSAVTLYGDKCLLYNPSSNLTINNDNSGSCLPMSMSKFGPEFNFLNR